MTKKSNGGNREEVPLEKIVISNMYSIEGIINLLVKKEIITKEEVLKEMELVVKEKRNTES